MKRTVKIFPAGVLLFCCIVVQAQTFEQIEMRNFWNEGSNVAGLRTDSVSISTARLYGRYEEGGFRDTYMPASAWRAGAEAKTITHLKTFSMSGAFSFDNLSGKGMCGSMSSRPGYYPVDVLEFTPGSKTMQTYSADGNIAVDLNDVFVLGGGIDYMAGNYTKRKDLRHTTWMMDMKVSAGLTARLGDGIVLGVSYFYNKNSEKIIAEELGISSESYYAFLDKGMMFGLYDIWSGRGIHLNNFGVKGFPVRENRHGAAIQFGAGGFFAEAEYVYGRGKSGEKDLIWFDFPSNRATLRLGWQFGSRNVRHFLRGSASYFGQHNNESFIVEETENGVSTNVNYGSNRIYERRNLSVAVGYEAVAENWEFGINAWAEEEKGISSYIYPYICLEGYNVAGVSLKGMAKIWKFELGAEIDGRTGQIDDGIERIAEGAIPGEVRPFHLTDYELIQNEYRTAPRLSAGISLRYCFWKGLYAEVLCDYIRAFNLKYVAGCDRIGGSLSFGYTF